MFCKIVVLTNFSKFTLTHLRSVTLFISFVTLITYFGRDEYHEFCFCSWKIMRNKRRRSQTFFTRKHLYKSLFFNEVTRQKPTTLLKRYLILVSHNFLETYFIDYLQMVPSETTSTCKLCIVCKGYSSQQARWPGERYKKSIDEKKLRFILSGYSLKGVIPDLNYSVKSFNFSMMQRRLYLPISLLWHAKNDSFNLYINRALLDRELLDRVS